MSALGSLIPRLRRLLDYLETPALFDARRRGIHVGFAGALIALRRRFGIEPATVIDVGANVGRFSEAARFVYPTARILAFEPIPDCVAAWRRRLGRDPLARIEQVAISNRAGTCAFHLTQESELASLLHPEPGLAASFGAQPAAVRVIEVEARTLDDALGGEEPIGPALLKIDVQGAELEVLRGASRSLRACACVKLELSFDAFYRGQARAGELFVLLEGAGFGRFIVEDAVIAGGTVHWCDLVLLRDRPPGG